MAAMRALTAVTVTALAAAVLTGFSGSPARADEAVTGAHGVAMHGTLKYGPDFQHLDYVNPDAPKGGELRQAEIGGFDSLNAFILRGDPAAGLSLISETLTEQTQDEPFSEYGLIARTIEIPADRSSVSYTLRPEARWHDGQPITVEDVIWSFETLKEKGHPFYRSYYAEVLKAEASGPNRVTFTFKRAGNRELPLIMGQLPVLPKHYWATRDPGQTTLEPPLGSGPYRIAAVEPGRGITYERVKDYWGRDLPLNRGRYNFDRLRFDYFRDAGVALEAFFAGAFDFRAENIAKTWATSYDAPPVKAGQIIKREVKHQLPSGMQAFVYNTRRPLFQDRRVRQALAYLFDFEWSNRNLAFGAYVRTASYFSNSELASAGAPSAAELAVLEPFKGQEPQEVFTTGYQPPVTDGSGNNRANLRQALELLTQAGWLLKDNKLVNAQTGAPFKFEIVDQSPAFSRWVGPFIDNLKRIGIEASFRLVDSAQYQNLLNDFDFDMTISVFPQSLSPGNEQLDFWGSSRAETKGSRNLAGVKDPVVDALIDQIIQAPDRQALVTRVQALDRVLLWGFYVIPQWHFDRYRLAYWDKFGLPEKTPPYGLGVADTWWEDPAKAAALAGTLRRPAQ